MAKHQAAERSYESLFICPADVPQKTVDSFVEKIKQALAPSKGILNSFQVWGRRRLTFPIKHHRDGLYIFIDYKAGPSANESLKNLFHVTDFVLRYMITDKVELKPPFIRRPPPSEMAGAASGAAASNAPAGHTAPPTSKEV